MVDCAIIRPFCDPVAEHNTTIIVQFLFIFHENCANQQWLYSIPFLNSHYPEQILIFLVSPFDQTDEKMPNFGLLNEYA